MIVLDLDKNQTAGILNLSKTANINFLKGVLNWDPHPLYKECVTNGYDLDIFLFALNSNGKITGAQDVIYFKNKVGANGALAVPVDNQTGEGDDDEFFTADLAKIPASISEVAVYVFIHEAEKRGQHFGMIADAGFELVDADTGETKVRYRVTQDFSGATALHVANIVRGADGWEVHPMGTSANADPNQVAAAYM